MRISNFLRTQLSYIVFAQKYYQDCALNSFLNIINHSESYTILKPEYYTDESTDWYTTEKAFNKNLENEKAILNEWKTVVPGVAKGRLIGGNADSFSLLYGNPYCSEVQDGDVLFLENINEEADFLKELFPVFICTVYLIKYRD